MITVQYPDTEFRMKKENGKQFIFDAIRKSWLLLTEEEWVRQNIVNYLITVLKYPSTVIALEKEILLNDLKKRFDVLVYDRELKPWMMIECKARSVRLSEDVLQQVLRYNITIPVEYILITNGNTTIGWKKENHGLAMLSELPLWSERFEVSG